MGFFLVFAGFDLKSLIQQETLPIELIKSHFIYKLYLSICMNMKYWITLGTFLFVLD